MANIEKHNNFIEKYRLENCKVELKKVKTELDAFNSELPTLATIKKEVGENQYIGYLGMWISHYVSLVNTNKSLELYQIEMLIELIFEEFHYLKLSDIHLVFKNALRGKYEKVYGALSIETIMSWFYSYTDKRANDVNQMNEGNDENKEKPDMKNRSNKIESLQDLKNKLEYAKLVVKNEKLTGKSRRK